MKESQEGQDSLREQLELARELDQEGQMNREMMGDLMGGDEDDDDDLMAEMEADMAKQQHGEMLGEFDKYDAGKQPVNMHQGQAQPQKQQGKKADDMFADLMNM